MEWKIDPRVGQGDTQTQRPQEIGGLGESSEAAEFKQKPQQHQKRETHADQSQFRQCFHVVIVGVRPRVDRFVARAMNCSRQLA